MAVANLKSTLITNRDATPKVLTDAFISQGQALQSYGWVFTASGDSAGSQYRMVSVPSNARLSNLDYVMNTLGSGCFLDVGVWYPTVVPVGGGVFLSSALSATLISSSNFTTNLAEASTTTFTTLMSISNTRQGPNYQEMPLWQMLNLSADPEIMLDIGFSLRLATAAAGYIGMKASYIA